MVFQTKTNWTQAVSYFDMYTRIWNSVWNGNLLPLIQSPIYRCFSEVKAHKSLDGYLLYTIWTIQKCWKHPLKPVPQLQLSCTMSIKVALRITFKLAEDNIMGLWVKRKNISANSKKCMLAGRLDQFLFEKLSLDISAWSSTADLLYWILTCSADWQVAEIFKKHFLLAMFYSHNIDGLVFCGTW